MKGARFGRRTRCFWQVLERLRLIFGISGTRSANRAWKWPGFWCRASISREIILHSHTKFVMSDEKLIISRVRLAIACPHIVISRVRLAIACLHIVISRVRLTIACPHIVISRVRLAICNLRFVICAAHSARCLTESGIQVRGSGLKGCSGIAQPAKIKLGCFRINGKPHAIEGGCKA